MTYVEMAKTVQQLIVLLIVSLIIDFIGVLSYLLPIVGELFDIPWAPISGLLVKHLYPELPPAVPWFAFIEEILPGTDFIPTATICWAYVAFQALNDKYAQLKRQ